MVRVFCHVATEQSSVAWLLPALCCASMTNTATFPVPKHMLLRDFVCKRCLALHMRDKGRHTMAYKTYATQDAHRAVAAGCPAGNLALTQRKAAQPCVDRAGAGCWRSCCGKPWYAGRNCHRLSCPRRPWCGRSSLPTLADGTLLRHAQVTLVEIALGLAIGLSAAFVLGYFLGKHRHAGTYCVSLYRSQPEHSHRGDCAAY